MSDLENYDYILNDFLEILDNFKIESKKPFKGNEFAAKIRNDFSQDFIKFIKSIVSDEEKYYSKFLPGLNNWFNDLWVSFYNKDVTESVQTGIFLIYLFEADGSGLTLSLVQGRGDSKKFLENRAEFLKKIVREQPLDIPYGFVENEEDGETIISKFYKTEDLNIDNILSDFKKIIKLYEYLIPFYNDFRAGEEPAKKDLRPNNSGAKIWRIAPGDAYINNYAWEEFKKDAYVGIGFQYGEEEVDYSKFKNKFSLEKYLDQFEIKAPSKSMIWKFVNWIRKGDIVIVNKGRSKLAGIGVVTGNFIPPTINENKNEFGLNSVRSVKWIYAPDDLEVPQNFFARHALVEWQGEKWNQLLCILARNDEKLKENILKQIYDESYKLLFERDDYHHTEGYKEESKEINDAWNEILIKYDKNEDIADDIWEKLVNRNMKVHGDGSKNVKASIKGKSKLSDEDLNQTAILLFKTLKELIGNRDEADQKRILNEFYDSGFSKGFKSGRFSSILYYLDDYYYVINQKTIDSVKLLSLILGDEIILSNELNRYISSNARYKDFINNLKNTFYYDKYDVFEFKTFDTICHYLCTTPPIRFATNKADKIPIDFYVNIDKILDSSSEISLEYEDSEDEELEEITEEYIEETKYEILNLNPQLLESKLKSFAIAESTVNQLCASLNAGKNIILDGTPGTGKTELAIKFATAASDNNFIDGYILTTATSDWSTFDTIGGLMPNEKGELFFYPGKFLDAIAENKWLIIDEINRADIDKAFGQLFTVLSKQDVELPYKENDKPIKIKLWDENYSKHDEEKATYYIGNNWRIIGTMNVDDKDSLFDLSYAFMRRFMFIEVDLPEESEYKRLIRMWSNDLSEEYATNLLRVYDVIKFRKLGPAIFKDMAEYIKFRDEISEDSTDLILAEAISSYIVPQFEGLNRNKVEQIRKLIGDIGLSSYLDEELESLIPKY